MSLSVISLPRINASRDPIECKKTLPPNCMPFAEFRKNFHLAEIATEQLHPLTMRLSQTIHRNPIQGLELLCQVEERVIAGFTENISHLLNVLVSPLKTSFKKGKRLFLIGSGSSGRIAIDLAAKARMFSSEYGAQVEGIIAGGDGAMIRAKEGFEDSEKEGENLMRSLQLDEEDIVILISGSGSSSFNVGCGHFAAEKGLKVYYFYNSSEIPKRTQELFNRKDNPVFPLRVDIGPQAIAGSTRLQSATLEEVCLGTVLAVSLSETLNDEPYQKMIAEGMGKILQSIRGQLTSVNTLLQAEVKIFSDPSSNFQKIRDETDQGYVTFVTFANAIRETFLDTTEAPPTFSTSPLRRENEFNAKREEFRAFLFGENDNKRAWKLLLGRDIHEEEAVSQFLLGSRVDGINAFSKRPKGQGNVVIGVLKCSQDEQFLQDLLTLLQDVRKERGETAIIIIAEKNLVSEEKKAIQECCKMSLVLENIPFDCFGILPTIALKWILNLISNGSMITMNKVFGNLMIDVNPSNNKLIDRCMRIIQDIWKRVHPDQQLDGEMLYSYVQHVRLKKNEKNEEGCYIPSVVKIVLTMLHYHLSPQDFDEIIQWLTKNGEDLEFLETIN